MGVILRLKERVRECSCFGAAPHVPLTSNARNEEMLKAANRFSIQVGNCMDAIKAGCATNLKLLSTTQTAMSQVLPQAYDDHGEGAVPVTTAIPVGGHNAEPEKVSSLGNDMVHKLEIEVLAPLTRWQGVHSQLQSRYKALENARLEVDARRHDHSKLAQKVSAMRVKVSDGIQPETKVDPLIHALSHKEAQVKIATENFDQQEAQLARDLEALITDAHYLKHYIAAALRLQGTALLDGSDTFGELDSSATQAQAAATSPASANGRALPASPLGTSSIASEAGEVKHAEVTDSANVRPGRLNDGPPRVVVEEVTNAGAGGSAASPRGVSPSVTSAGATSFAASDLASIGGMLGNSSPVVDNLATSRRPASVASKLSGKMVLARCLKQAPQAANDSPVGTASPLMHTTPSSRPGGHSPDGGGQTEAVQRSVEEVPLAAAAPAAGTPEAGLAQLEKEELEETEPHYGPRGSVRCLGQSYAHDLGLPTMARLRAELEEDSELRARFDELLWKDDGDWETWDAMTKWYDTKTFEFDDAPGQFGRPVAIPLHIYHKFNHMWGCRCWKPNAEPVVVVPQCFATADLGCQESCSKLSGKMVLACCLKHDPQPAEGSPAVTASPPMHSTPSSRPGSHSPDGGGQTEAGQRSVEVVPRAAAAPAAAPAAATPEAGLAQLEKEELEETEPHYGPRGSVRCLGQSYAQDLGLPTMARLRAELEEDGELRARFDELLWKNDGDWETWDAMTKWYNTKSLEFDFGPCQFGRPVAIPLHIYLKFNHIFLKSLTGAHCSAVKIHGYLSPSTIHACPFASGETGARSRLACAHNSMLWTSKRAVVTLLTLACGLLWFRGGIYKFLQFITLAASGVLWGVVSGFVVSDGLKLKSIYTNYQIELYVLMGVCCASAVLTASAALVRLVVKPGKVKEAELMEAVAYARAQEKMKEYRRRYGEQAVRQYGGAKRFVEIRAELENQRLQDEMRREVFNSGLIPDEVGYDDDIYIPRHPQWYGWWLLPNMVDLSAWPIMPNVLDQGQMGTCTVQAAVNAFRFALEKEARMPAYMPSRMFIFYNAKRHFYKQAVVDYEKGMSIRAAFDSIKRFNACDEKVFPYGVHMKHQSPSQSAYDNANRHKHPLVPIKLFNNPEKVDPGRKLYTIMSALSRGHPIAVGLSYLSNLWVNNKTVMLYPPEQETQAMRFNEKLWGSHAVLLVGYNWREGTFKFQNSYGVQRGQQGYFYAPVEYLVHPTLSRGYWMFNDKGGSGVRRHSAALPAEPLPSAAHVRHSVLPTEEASFAVAQELTSMMNAPAASGWGWPFTAAMEEAEARVPSLPPGTLPEVTLQDFSRYLRSIGDRLQSYEQDRQASSQQRKPQALNPDELRASQGQGLVAAMRDVPAPFFQESFDVDQQQLWEEVVQVDSEGVRQQSLERLSGYLEVVEAHLVREIAARTDNFFDASGYIQDVRGSVARLYVQVSALRKQMHALEQETAAQLQTSQRLLRQRANLAATLDVLRTMDGVAQAQGALQGLLPRSGGVAADYGGAIDVLEVLQGVLDDETLLALECFKHLPQQIGETAQAVDDLMTSDFLERTRFSAQAAAVAGGIRDRLRAQVAAAEAGGHSSAGPRRRRSSASAASSAAPSRQLSAEESAELAAAAAVKLTDGAEALQRLSGWLERLAAAGGGMNGGGMGSNIGEGDDDNEEGGDSLQEALLPLVIGLQRMGRLPAAMRDLKASSVAGLKELLSQVLEACLEVLDPEPSPGDSSHLLAGPRSASPGREPPTAAEKLQRLPGQDFQWVLEAVVLAATAFLGHCQAVGEAVSLILSLAQAPAQQLAAAERDMAECRAAVAEAATARWSKLLGSRARGGGAEGVGGGTGVLELTDVMAALVERHGGTRGVLGLRTALQQLCKATLDNMHGKALSKLTTLLDQEQWVPVQVPLQFQELVEELEQQGAAAALSAAQSAAQASAAAAAGAGAGAAAAAAHPHPRRHTAAPVLGGGHANGVSGGGSGGAANGSAGAWPADALPVAAAAAGGGGAESEGTAVPRKFTITPHDNPSHPGTATAPGAAAAASSSLAAEAGAGVQQAARAPFTPVLVVAGQGYHVVNTQLLLLSMLREYRRFHAAMPAFAAEVAQRVLELLKVFNSRTCQLVLGAGAMQVSGLKSITAKHLAISCQCLGAFMALHPALLALFTAGVAPPRLSMLTADFKRALQDYRIHHEELCSKLVSIMRERLSINLKQLPAQAAAWSGGGGGGGGGQHRPLDDPGDQPPPSAFAATCAKQLTILSGALAPLLLPAELHGILGRIALMFSRTLSEAYELLEPHGPAWEQQLRADVQFLLNCLRNLPQDPGQRDTNLERLTQLFERRFLAQAQAPELPREMGREMAAAPSQQAQPAQQPQVQQAEVQQAEVQQAQPQRKEVQAQPEARPRKQHPPAEPLGELPAARSHPPDAAGGAKEEVATRGAEEALEMGEVAIRPAQLQQQQQQQQLVAQSSSGLQQPGGELVQQQDAGNAAVMASSILRPPSALQPAAPCSRSNPGSSSSPGAPAPGNRRVMVAAQQAASAAAPPAASGVRAEDFIRPHLLQLKAYTPIEPFEILAKRLGREAKDIVKLDANENPYGPPPEVLAALGSMPFPNIYPDPESRQLREALAKWNDVPAEHLLVGCGADELIDLLMRCVLDSGDAIVDCPPTFTMYVFDAAVNNARVVTVPRLDGFKIDVEGVKRAVAEHRPKIVFLTSPNNPDGSVLSSEELLEILALPVLVVLDEAYIEFSEEASKMGWVATHPNLIVLRTFSKCAALAGLRVGYGAFPLGLIQYLWRAKQPYNVSVAAEVAAVAALTNLPYIERVRDALVEERQRLFDGLAAVPYLQPAPSQANFVLCKVEEGRDARALKDALAQQYGIMVRHYATAELNNYVRVSVGLPEHTDKLLAALEQLA
ncbi:Histidinol-phosphate aminotransferase 2 [Chlorella vulgaris]